MNRLDQPLARLLDRRGCGDWQPVIDAWRESAAGRALVDAVDARVAAGAIVYPDHVLRALELTPLARTRVLILGQDPYHGPGQAEGLAFSVPAGQRIPPSLRNIFKELQRDLGLAPPASGSLAAWAERGVLLLNATLTVEDGQAGAHAKLGWHALTDAICAVLAADPAPKVFMLWGAHAQAQVSRLDAAPGHLVLQANHPSPLSALRPPVPFIGCGHFSRANRHLTEAGRGAIDWSLT
ncbi:MAG: uracil-DNA glycosylase [Burkholderiales bacterium]|nr:uracil-DNA glycosylase [Burkholderiales bacterium]